MSPRNPQSLSAAAVNRQLSLQDPILGTIITSLGPLPLLRKHGSLLAAVARSIVGQQLSVAAARTIFTRLKAACNGAITAQNLLRLNSEQLRALGLSAAKARSLHGCAHSCKGGRLLPQLSRCGDEQAKELLVALPGIGPWTAEMILLGHLGRPDIFAPGDAGLRRAIEKAYQLTRQEYLTQWPDISSRWAPYRSTACRYLWKWLDA